MYGIYTYIWLIFMVNVAKNIPYMDPMGNEMEELSFQPKWAGELLRWIALGWVLISVQPCIFKKYLQ